MREREREREREIFLETDGSHKILERQCEAKSKECEWKKRERRCE